MRSVTTHDPEWTTDDRDLALAWQADSDDRCPGCGQPRHEAWSAEAEGTYHDRLLDLRCHACKAKKGLERAIAESKDKTATDGRYIVVRAREED